MIGEDEIEKHLLYERLIPAMRKALREFSAGVSRQPLRTVMRLEAQDGWFAAMPAATEEVFGAKLVTFFPGNAGRLPTHMAVIQLFRLETGEPLATFDGRLITEMRTAAVSAVATDLLARKDAAKLAILGSGVQARAHFEALGHVRRFERVRVWSRTPAHADELASDIGARVARTAEEAVEDADVVVVATSAAEPVLRGAWLKPDAYVNAIGAIGPDRREMDDDAMRARVVVESREAAIRESGDVILSGAKVWAELGELLAGTVTADQGERYVFKSLGIGVEDVAAAWLVWNSMSKTKLKKR